jgi:hypothetical protein
MLDEHAVLAHTYCCSQGMRDLFSWATPVIHFHWATPVIHFHWATPVIHFHWATPVIHFQAKVAACPMEQLCPRPASLALRTAAAAAVGAAAA